MKHLVIWSGVLVLCGVVWVISSGTADEALGWVGVLMCVTLTLLYAVRNRSSAAILGCAVGIRLAVLLVNEYWFPVPLIGGGDERRFHEMAAEWAARGGPDLGGLLQRSGSSFYIGILAYGYTLVGTSQMFMQCVNILAGTLAVVEVLKLTTHLSGPDAARKAAWVASFFPTLIVYSVALLREAFFVLAFLIGVRCLIQWVDERGTARLALSFVALIAAASFHPSAIAAVGVAIVVAIFDIGGQQNHAVSARFLRWAGSSVIAGICLVLLMETGWGTADKLDVDEDISLETIVSSQSVAARDRAGYLPELTISHPADIVWQVPIRLTYFLFSPFLWRISTFGDAIGFLDALLYAALCLAIIRQRNKVKGAQARTVVLGCIFSCSIVLALFTSNYGTALRHRAKIAPLMIAAAAAHVPISRRHLSKIDDLVTA